jgi:membrane associated rhomboid family serine protease
MSKLPGAIKVLIIINVVVFGIAQIPAVRNLMYGLLAMFLPLNPNFQYWQVVTSMFMHGGYMHIILNMYALWAFGSPFEIIWGKKRFLIFYFVSGIGAGLIYLAVNYFQYTSLYNDFMAMGVSANEIQNILLMDYDVLREGNFNISTVLPLYAEGVDVSALKEQMKNFYMLFHIPAVGASGAIYGILVAFGMSFPNSKLALIFLPVPIPAKFFIPVLIGIDLFSGVTGFSIFGGGVAHFAHVGGALVGFLLVWYWKVSGAIRIPVQYE